MASTGFPSAAAAAATSSSSPRPPDRPLPICSMLASYTEEPTSFVLVGGCQIATIAHACCPRPPPVEDAEEGQSENPDAASMQMRIILTAMYIETFIVQSTGTNPCSSCRFNSTSWAGTRPPNKTTEVVGTCAIVGYDSSSADAIGAATSRLFLCRYMCVHLRPI
ncbi:hypothetical protein OsJ_28818 [Oryza sativa Japonica Group]|uniref:Uncharacterized protein n=1 Tax=Oryza sativa subsp. japonica TaxID=39947 RepID=B9G2T5_ORYSJ|nr:hypothetical protein OsJ_28818 [Oryza sativa Japonica Group]